MIFFQCKLNYWIIFFSIQNGNLKECCREGIWELVSFLIDGEKGCFKLLVWQGKEMLYILLCAVASIIIYYNCFFLSMYYSMHFNVLWLLFFFLSQCTMLYSSMSTSNAHTFKILGLQKIVHVLPDTLLKIFFPCSCFYYWDIWRCFQME